jgi:pimeloyl-ACP methyl ester carboxylesterase
VPLALPACSLNDLRTAERLDRGLVIILPGIEGRSLANANVARGLDDGGVDAAIVIEDWGTSVPGGFLINLTDMDRNHAAAQRVCERILQYQDERPGRPIHLIGHSGGGGLAIMALERLPNAVRVDSVILLAACIDPNHDLRTALARSRHGILNYHSRHDRLLLDLGTSVFGTIDRTFGPAAGADGFHVPGKLSPADNALYHKLIQIPWSQDLFWEGHDGGHFGWTHPVIVKRHIAPRIVAFSAKPNDRESNIAVLCDPAQADSPYAPTKINKIF